MKRIIWIAVGLMVAGCAPSRRSLPLPGPVDEQPAAVASVVGLDPMVRALAEQNDGMGERAAGLDRALVVSRAALARAVQRVEELESGGTINDAEIGELRLLLAAAWESEQWAGDQVTVMRQAVEAQKESIGGLEAEVARVSLALAAKDGEVKGLRAQNKDLRGAVSAQESALAAQAKELVAVSAKYNAAKPYRNWMIIGGCILVALVVARAVIWGVAKYGRAAVVGV